MRVAVTAHDAGSIGTLPALALVRMDPLLLARMDPSADHDLDLHPGETRRARRPEASQLVTIAVAHLRSLHSGVKNAGGPLRRSRRWRAPAPRSSSVPKQVQAVAVVETPQRGGRDRAHSNTLSPLEHKDKYANVPSMLCDPYGIGTGHGKPA